MAWRGKGTRRPTTRTGDPVAHAQQLVQDVDNVIRSQDEAAAKLLYAHLGRALSLKPRLPVDVRRDVVEARQALGDAVGYGVLRVESWRETLSPWMTRRRPRRQSAYEARLVVEVLDSKGERSLMQGEGPASLPSAAIAYLKGSTHYLNPSATRVLVEQLEAQLEATKKQVTRLGRDIISAKERRRATRAT